MKSEPEASLSRLHPATCTFTDSTASRRLPMEDRIVKFIPRSARAASGSAWPRAPTRLRRSRAGRPGSRAFPAGVARHAGKDAGDLPTFEELFPLFFDNGRRRRP